MSAKNPQPRADHSKEIYGILFLAIGSFIGLCLYSYNPLDPSLNSLASGGPTANLGGIVGSYLSDLLFMVLGLGAIVIPILFVFLSFSCFALKPVRARWSRALSFALLVGLISVTGQLIWQEITLKGHAMQAGGLIGWSIAQVASRYLGNLGTYLFVIAGLALSTLWLTEISFVKLIQLVKRVGQWISMKLLIWTRLSWARFMKGFRKEMAQVVAQFQAWRARVSQKKEKEVKIASHDPEMESLRALLDRNAPVTKTNAIIEADKRPERQAGSPASGGSEPTVSQRKDLNSGRNKQGTQLTMVSLGGKFELPQLSYLDAGSDNLPKPVDEKSLKMNARVLEKKLLDFGVEGQVVAIHPGPVITMYEFEPAPGVKVNKIVNLGDDLSVAMGGKSVRIVPHLPGKAAIGIEIPNSERETVWLSDIIGNSKFQRTDSKLALAIGKDSEGYPLVTDLAKMPHLLVAGSTGSGKSVSINTMICSLLYKATPEEVRLILVDPKMLELSIYEKIPHLLVPVVTDPKKAAQALRWAVREMDRRYHLMADAGIRNIAAYNKQFDTGEIDKERTIEVGHETLKHEEKLPYIVVIIDELADLMMVCSKDLEDSIMRLAQKARAAGVHLILATQRPSVDVITGVIKANLPTRMSFKVSARHDSRTILDQIGAERLLGAGDMLYLPPNSSDVRRVHGAFVTEKEIQRIVAHLRKQAKPIYREEILQAPPEAELGGFGEDNESDELYDRAVSLVCQTRQASISMVQRHLRIGYNRAARMIERMESEGVVGPADGSKPREVLVQNLAEEG